MPPPPSRLREVLDRLPIVRAPVTGGWVTGPELVALAILLAAALAGTLLVWRATTPPSAEDPAAAVVVTPAASPSPDPSPSGTAAASAPVVVHVDGHVLAPGVVAVPPGSRVVDAIAAAGGLAVDAVTRGLNLARHVEDGELVVVPGPGDPTPVAQSAPVPGGGPPDTPRSLDLNAATVADLDALPGVGPVMAERIVAHRTEIGGYADVAQLLEVPGIGPARFAELEARVRVG